MSPARRPSTPRTSARVGSQGQSTSTRRTARPRHLRGIRTGKRFGTAADGVVVLETAGAMLEASRRWRVEGRSIGLVPTMGALHAGHLSLVELARGENDIVVVSIFVNPIQFGPGEDFERYPRDVARDTGMLARAEVDAIYEPPVEVMYRHDSTTRVHVGAVAEPLEGETRQVSGIQIASRPSSKPGCGQSRLSRWTMRRSSTRLLFGSLELSRFSPRE